MITMKLDGHGVEIEIEDNNKKRYKYLNISRFLRCVSGDLITDTGLLPGGTIAFCRSRKGTRVALVRPAGVQSVSYEVSDGTIPEFKIFVPSLLWIFNLNDRSCIQATRVFALEAPVINPKTQIYHFPFSNVYITGVVCWGEAAFLKIPLGSLMDLSLLPAMFFAKPFNHDLESGIRGGTYSFFEDHNGELSFPDDLLRPFGIFEEAWKNED